MTTMISSVWRAASMATLALLCGCATLTYEAEEWRVAVPAQGDAHAVVRYIGLATPSATPATRDKLAAKIEDMARDTTPSSSFAPLRTVTGRKVYMEGGKIVLEEAGTLRNPFTWFNQSGLNPATWWSPAPELVRKEEFVVKRDIESPRKVIATDGRVVDEGTYTTILKSRLPVEISSDTKWQRQEDRPTEDDVRTQQAELIMWPRNARAFYWKISGPAFGKPSQLLSREYVARVKPRRPAPAPPPEPEPPAAEPVPETPVTVTPLPAEPPPPAKTTPLAKPTPPTPPPVVSPTPPPTPPVPPDAGLVPVGGLQPLDDDATIK